MEVAALVAEGLTIRAIAERMFIADAAQNGFLPTGQSAGNYHLTATGDVGTGYPFLGSGGPRGLQLAAKFTF